MQQNMQFLCLFATECGAPILRAALFGCGQMCSVSNTARMRRSAESMKLVNLSVERLTVPLWRKSPLIKVNSIAGGFRMR